MLSDTGIREIRADSVLLSLFLFCDSGAEKNTYLKQNKSYCCSLCFSDVKYVITVSTVRIPSFRKDRSIQTEETKIRLLFSSRSY